MSHTLRAPISRRQLHTSISDLSDQVWNQLDMIQSALRNETITRARVEALEARLTMFESMPLRKRLTWLLVGR